MLSAESRRTYKYPARHSEFRLRASLGEPGFEIARKRGLRVLAAGPSDAAAAAAAVLEALGCGATAGGGRRGRGGGWCLRYTLCCVRGTFLFRAYR